MEGGTLQFSELELMPPCMNFCNGIRAAHYELHAVAPLGAERFAAWAVRPRERTVPPTVTRLEGSARIRSRAVALCEPTR